MHRFGRVQDRWSWRNWAFAHGAAGTWAIGSLYWGRTETEVGAVTATASIRPTTIGVPPFQSL